LIKGKCLLAKFYLKFPKLAYPIYAQQKGIKFSKLVS